MVTVAPELLALCWYSKYSIYYLVKLPHQHDSARQSRISHMDSTLQLTLLDFNEV